VVLHQRTAYDRVLGVHLALRPVKANEVRVYVVRGPSSNRKRPQGRCASKIDRRRARIRTVVPVLFSL
jgi:hypothetical protein